KGCDASLVTDVIDNLFALRLFLIHNQTSFKAVQTTAPARHPRRGFFIWVGRLFSSGLKTNRDIAVLFAPVSRASTN
ncbi:hypothetical protein QWV86_11100, partial [Neisseria gonorrhoeae]|uniref:hypothetical protein n=1 Tax=Neisseria gonorrhoeae TaxID=485 RepID=UPI001C85D158